MENQVVSGAPLWTPECSVCKKKDETLRVVAYPYVVSIVVMSFRRAFSGIYCRKHQRWYHLLASLITSTVGWLGIPFGFVMTPIALLNLARGGIMNTEANIKLLTAVADKKVSEGDSMGAVRCLEECLKLKEDPQIRSRLVQMYQVHRASTRTHDSETLWQILGVPLLILTSALVGLVIGLLDLLLAYLLSPLFPAEGSIFIAIASWLPTVTMIFMGIVFVRAVLRWTLNKNGRISLLLGNILAITATFSTFYSFLEGQAVIRNLQGFLTIFAFSFSDFLFAIRSVLSHGGVDVLINNFMQGDAPSVISTALLIAGIALSLFVNMEMVTQMTSGQRRITQLRELLSMNIENPIIFAWGTFGFMFLGLILFLAVAFPGRYVNVEAAYQKISLGMAELDQYHPEKAIVHFQGVQESWPNSAMSRIFTGISYSYQDKYDKGLQEIEKGLELDPSSSIGHLFRGYILIARSEFDEAIDEHKIVIQAQPNWGLPHASLATLYYEIDKVEEAEQEIQQAILYSKEDSQALSTIAAYYFARLDFKQAETYALRAIELSNTPSDHLYLVRIYLAEGKNSQAQGFLEEAEKLGADPIEIYKAKINLAEYRLDMDTAASLVAEALKLWPEDSDLYSEKSFIALRQGHIETAIADAEKALTLNPYNSFAYVDLAYAYHADGKVEEAIAAAKKAIPGSPLYDRGHYILGVCYMEKGLKEEAVKEFETFLKLYWDRPIAREEKSNAETYLKQLK
ncbi:MAG: tetratricopeptide repeat protein [Anaerolineales bacterium]